MRQIFYLPKFLFFSNINVVPFKIVPLGSYTPMETLFPLLLAALEFFNRYGHQHVRYTCDQVFDKDVLETFRKRVIRVRQDIADKRMLHHNNAPYHTALSVTELFTSKGIPVVPQPLYLTSAPGTFSFLLNLKMSS
jgi:hypothetical protein